MTGKKTESQFIDFKAIVKISRSGIRTVNTFTTTDKIIEARNRVKDRSVRSLLLDLLVFFRNTIARGC